jgi:hypothetical protein
MARLAVLALVGALGGCSFASEALWPSLPGSGAGRPATTTRIELPAPAAEQAAATAASAGTQTAVGQRAAQLREEAARLAGQVAAHQQTLRQLRGENVDAAQRYQSLVGQINARLQVGTTPGNPMLTQQLAQAQAELDRFSANTSAASQLSTQIGASASLGAFLLEAVRSAYTISGAVDEDHRQLSQTEEEVGRTMVSVERLRVETTEDVARHTAYAGRERANLVALGAAVRTGEFLGPGLASRTIDTAAPARPGGAAAARPIVVVRFDRPNPVFEQSLYAAATRALEVRPQVSFDVVGIAAGGDQGARSATATAEARRQAEQVMRVLVEMGMPAQRVRMSTRSDATLTANEVHVLAR